jgi:hypothetical protein
LSFGHREATIRQVNVFILSVIDDGGARNVAATDLRVNHDDVLIEASGVTHLFRLVDVIDIIPLGDEKSNVPKSSDFRSRRVS